MTFEGDKELLQRLFQKKRLLEEGDERHKEIRPLLLILSGILRGVYGGGQIIALEKFGLSNIFDFAVGISTGAPLVAYLLSEKSKVGVSIYYEECTTNRFISYWKMKMDTAYLARVFRGEESDKSMDLAKILASRTEFFVGVTCAETGKGELINVKKSYPDLVQPIHASISIPRLSRHPIQLGKRSYWDGGGALSFPAQEVVRRFEPTDVLVLANTPGEELNTLAYQLGCRTLFAGLPSGVQASFTPANRNTSFAKGLSDLRGSNCNFGILWSDTDISGFERNPSRLKSAVVRAEEHLSGLLKEAKDLTD